MQTQLSSGEEYPLFRFITWMNKRKLLSFCVNVDKAAHLFWKFTYRRYATASFTKSKHPWDNQLWSIYYLHIWCSILNAELNCTIIYIPTETLAFNLNRIFSVCSIWFCNRGKYGLALKLSMYLGRVSTVLTLKICALGSIECWEFGNYFMLL